MVTRPIVTALLPVLILAGCSGGPTSPGVLTAAATTTQATAEAGADRVASAKPKTIDIPWGDGQRKASYYTYVFNYTPVPPAKRTDDTVVSLTITDEGKVTFTYAGLYKENLRAELTADERKAFSQLSANLDFEYRTCPREPGIPQPYYTWQYLGSNNEFRAACPPNPTGLTMVMTPAVATRVAAFVQDLAKRLIGRTI